MRTSARLITFIAAGLLAVSSLSPPPALAWHLEWAAMPMRNTAASTVAQNRNWAARFPQPLSGGFADSLGIIRRGATTRTLIDTSAAFVPTQWPAPPTFSYRGAAFGARAQMVNSGAAGGAVGGAIDSVIVDTTDATPWIMVRVRQDTTSASFSSSGITSSSLDSAVVAAQFSNDGINWFNVQGTPTRAYHAVLITTAEDGTQPPALAGKEPVPGADCVTFNLQYQPSLNPNSPIINRNLRSAGNWVRFLGGVLGGSGQFVWEVASWKPDPGDND